MSWDERPEAWHRLLVATFVGLADTLVDDFDVVEFLQALTERIVELDLAAEAGILLADADGRLQLMAASRERSRLLEVLQLQAMEGPCLESWGAGMPVVATDLSDDDGRWPRFAPEARSVGFHSVYAVPMSLRATRLGVLNLFHTEVGAGDEESRVIARGLADIATIGLVQQRSLRDSQMTAEQLQRALHSRIAIEQAKGVLAERLETSVEEAFALLRSYARDHNLKISDLARGVVRGERIPEDFRKR